VSPINGFVSKKMVNVGDMAKPGHPVLALESLDELKIEVDVPEFEIGKFEINDTVSITVSAVNLSQLKGVVERIIPSSSFSGQYKIIVSLSGKNSKLKPGMFAKIDLLKESKDKLLVNKSIIIRKGQLTGLYTVNQQSEAMLRWVRLGKEYGEKVEIISGLSAGEELIVSTSSKIADGIKVK
jgi:RND family efflux transporter MFP subunit